MEILEFTEGQNKMIITKDDKGNLISVKDQDGNDLNGVERTGDIADLKLGHALGQKKGEEKLKFRQNLFTIRDDTVIRTHSSPGCTWYFYQRRWYRICS